MRLGSRSDLHRGLVISRRIVAGWVGLGAVLLLSGSAVAANEPAAYLRVTPGAPAPEAAPATPLPTPFPVLPTLGPPTGLATGPVPGLSAALPKAPSGPFGVRSSSALTSSGIPQPAYAAYRAAEAALAKSDPTCGVSWTVIAGIGRVESNHGRFGGARVGVNGVVSPPILGIRLDGSRAGTARISDSDGGRFDGDTAFDRAVGPMQFLPGTWKAYGGGANPQDLNAAALATGKYLCAGGGDLRTQKGRWAAVYRYNHSDSYVSLVLSLADSYASGQGRPFPVRPGGTAPADDEPAATPPGPPPAAHDGDDGDRPTPKPTKTTPKPTKSSTPTPTGTPTTSPTAQPTTVPTTKPTTPPTTKPTTSPTGSPTGTPTTTPPTTTPTTTPTTSTTTTCPTPSATPTPTPTATPGPTPTDGCPTPAPAAPTSAPAAEVSDSSAP